MVPGFIDGFQHFTGNMWAVMACFIVVLYGLGQWMGAGEIPDDRFSELGFQQFNPLRIERNLIVERIDDDFQLRATTLNN